MGVPRPSLLAKVEGRTRARAVCRPGTGSVLACGGDRLDELADLVFVDAAGEVGLADDADQVVAVDHWEAADFVLGHRVQRFFDGVVGADRDRLALSELSSACVGGA